MFDEKISRRAFQAIAVLFFLYQMKQSISKYSYSPTSLTKLNSPTMELVYEPYFIVCQPNQFKYSKAKNFGYEWDTHLWAGLFSSNDDRKVTWKGKTGNLSFSSLTEELYDYDYSSIDINHGKLGEQFLSLNHGMCIQLDLGTEKMASMVTNRTFKLLAVDPNTFNKVRIDLDPKASVTLRDSNEGMYDWAEVLAEYTVTDNSIHDGISCRVYKDPNSYEKCVAKTLQVNLHLK